VKPSSLKTLSVALIVVSLLLGGAYYWGTTTIVADTTPPEISEASTHGSIAYGTGRPTVLLFVHENIGIEEATAELKYSTGFQRSIEKLTLSFDKKLAGDTYQYRGTFTEQLSQNTEYKLIYRVTDQADHSDSWTTTLKTVNLAGTVYVNGIEVKSPGDTIYVDSLDLTIAADVTPADSVSSIYGVVNGKRLTFTQGAGGDEGDSDEPLVSWLASVSSDAWIAEYLLPGDGTYSFSVQVLDMGGTDTQLASFTVELGGAHQTELIVAVFAVLAAAGLYMYLRPEGGR